MPLWDSAQGATKYHSTRAGESAMASIESYPAHGTGYTARDFMTQKLVTLNPGMDVFDGIETLIRHKVSGAPVVDADNRLLGVFSEKSCLEVLIDAAYDQLPTNRVSAFMDTTPHTISPTTGLLTVAQIFINTNTRRLPVVENGIVVGQVSRRDAIATAAKIHQQIPNRGESSMLLYLSAMRSMEDAPHM